jgi:hypothetical protein
VTLFSLYHVRYLFTTPVETIGEAYGASTCDGMLIGMIASGRRNLEEI